MNCFERISISKLQHWWQTWTLEGKLEFWMLLKQCDRHLVHDWKDLGGIYAEYIHLLVFKPLWLRIDVNDERSGLSAENDNTLTITGIFLFNFP